MTREEILETAGKLVAKDREATYGSPEVNLTQTAEYWTMYLDHKYDLGGLILTADDVALLMVLLKIARTCGPKFSEDNFIDMAGYAAIAGELANGEG